jgi:hypothetical protein
MRGTTFCVTSSRSTPVRCMLMFVRSNLIAAGFVLS